MAGLQPTVDMLELFALQMPNETFSGLLVWKRLIETMRCMKI